MTATALMRARAASTPRLGELVAGRANNIQLLRLVAAAAVLLFHCYALTDHWTDEPLWRLAHELNLGALGVQMFFLMSGFLVTQSWLARRRLVPFVAARALRIFPALVAATLLSALLGALSSRLPAAQFWRDPQTLDYLAHTPLGFDVRHYLPGAYASNPRPGAVNGSLYTLPYELRLYVVVALAGVAGILARRHALAAVLVAGIAAALAWPQWPNIMFADGTNEHVDVLVLLFALGSAAYVWRAAIALSPLGALAAVVLVALDPFGVARGVLFAPLLAYTLLTVAYHPLLRWRSFNRAGDYSYGLYVYAFPVQQTLIERLPGITPLALLAVALPATLVLAVVSWHALERPALSLKSWFDRTGAKP
ncbi:MAG TPA: acyltransferase [Casimicrobiaceae bacterium]|nr:acyltransferase [Casimicrobiaceae bacterium]